MIIIYWLVMIAIGVHFWGRRFDLFTLAFLSSCIYFIPAAIPNYPVDEGAYFIYIFVLFFAWLCAVINDRRTKNGASPEVDGRKLRKYFRGALVLFVPLLLASILHRSGNPLISKLDSGNGGLLHYSLSAVLGFLFVSALLLRRRVVMVVCLLTYSWIVLAGDRTQFVISMLAALVLFASYHEFSLRKIVLRLKWHQRALIVLTIAVGLFGKTLYGAYFDANAGAGFAESLQARTEQQLTNPISGFEPYHVQSILDLAIRSDDRIPSDYLLWLPVQALPFAANLGSEVHGQSEAVKTLYFSDWSRSSGVSSNFFAEGYLLWGYFGAVVFGILYALLLIPLARALTSRSVAVRLWACFAATFWAFYIHRSSIFQMMAHEKRILYAFIGVAIAGALIQAFVRVSQHHRP